MCIRTVIIYGRWACARNDNLKFNAAMGNFKRNHPVPKAGEIIIITARHCSEKIQPRMQVGGMFDVMSVGTTARGVMALKVRHPLKSKDTLSVNADRFDWRIVTEDELREKQFKDEVREDTKRLTTEFSEKEQTFIAFIPLMVEALAWIYADKCVAYAAKMRISETVKLTRTVRMLKQKRMSMVRKDLDERHQSKIETEADRFIKFCGDDFAIFYFTVNREYIKHCPDAAYKELSTYALMGMCLIKILDRLNLRVFKLIKERIGKENAIIRDPIIDSLYASFDAYAGNYGAFDFNDNGIQTCMRIFEIKLEQIDFNIVNGNYNDKNREYEK